MPEQKLRLAAIGDSLTQGFMSGAVFKTELSFPAIIARSMGLQIGSEFRVPRFPLSGLPFNIEEFLRSAGDELQNKNLGLADWIVRFPFIYQRFADVIEDGYERGIGSRPMPFSGSYHNLAVWGFRVYDSYTVSSKVCHKAIESDEGWIADDFLQLPSAAMYRTARRVLNPGQKESRDDFTQLHAVEHLIQTEGLDALTVSLGANDCLGTVLSLEVKELKGNVPKDPILRTQRGNLTSANQFEKDYEELGKQLSAILDAADAEDRPQVFLSTVPHVTIPPVTRGIGRYRDGYFDYYARFFIRNDSFNSWINAHLTRAEAVDIDQRIDGFNDVIRAVADKYGWHVVEVCEALDTLAVRRNGYEQDPGQALRDYFAKLGITDHPLLRLNPVPSILGFQCNNDGLRTSGGLFSLDGIHPSTAGYGIMADLVLRSMREHGIEGADPMKIDWHSLLQQDSLQQAAPFLWQDIAQVTRSNPTIWETIFSRLG